MKHLVLAMYLFQAGCFATVSAQAPLVEETAESSVLDEAFSATAALVDERGSYCSGVFVEDYVFTAAHCTSADWPIRVSSYRHYNSVTNEFDRTFPTVPVYLDVNNDIAVLQFVDRTPAHVNLRISAANPVLGQDVLAIGNPGDHSYYWTRGEVTNPNRLDDVIGLQQMRWFQINAHLIPGMSGGPVVTEDLQVLGLNSFIWWDTGGAVHTETLREALRSLHGTSRKVQ